ALEFPKAEQAVHAQAFATAFKQDGVAQSQTVELRDQIAAKLARWIHALRLVGELWMLVFEQMNEVAQRYFAVRQ
ncbi:hypothetical protein, partial [Acinetobacter baumannii]|uniref:hypothetical protein n=1 Tax=Acinetobacter baumannii TaxID=470 RepID=UPI003319541E